MNFLNISVNGIRFAYGKHPILNGLDFQMRSGEIIGIVGPNGCGKTTLLKCINKILTPLQGEVLLDGENLHSMKTSEIAKIMGYVPQTSSSDLSSPTVYEVVLMGRSPHMAWKASPSDEEIVWNSLEELNVRDLASHPFSELSSGQTQRVLIARALAQEASILLLDEPTSNLDLKYQIDVMSMIHKLSKKKGLGIFAIIHDLNLAMKYCDTILLMEKGKVTAIGKPDEVLTKESIKKVYDVDVIIDRNYGMPYIVVL